MFDRIQAMEPHRCSNDDQLTVSPAVITGDDLRKMAILKDQYNECRHVFEQQRGRLNALVSTYADVMAKSSRRRLGSIPPEQMSVLRSAKRRNESIDSFTDRHILRLNDTFSFC